MSKFDEISGKLWGDLQQKIEMKNESVCSLLGELQKQIAQNNSLKKKIHVIRLQTANLNQIMNE